jgi:hypothetical protein
MEHFKADTGKEPSDEEGHGSKSNSGGNRGSLSKYWSKGMEADPGPGG